MRRSPFSRDRPAFRVDSHDPNRGRTDALTYRRRRACYQLPVQTVRSHSALQCQTSQTDLVALPAERNRPRVRPAPFDGDASWVRPPILKLGEGLHFLGRGTRIVQYHHIKKTCQFFRSAGGCKRKRWIPLTRTYRFHNRLSLSRLPFNSPCSSLKVVD
jgi:hypothetical protein